MSVERYITAQEIINRAAIEAAGMVPSNDVFASTDPAFVQLRNLINTCGQDLCESFDWEILKRQHQITTTSADTGEYDLPEDFERIIDQTEWEHSNDQPIGGPLTDQQWTYLVGRNLINSTIYLSFRIAEDKFNIYPNDPVPDAMDINFEYISRNWVIPDGEPDSYSDKVQANGDIVLFKPIMMVQYLRYKFLDAKGFDSASALGAFTKSYMQATGGNKGAPILNAGRGRSGFPLIGYRNIPFTGYGG